MDCSITLMVLLISTAVCLCRGVVLVGEDKRQGLIPFPRVGRTFNQWLPSAASLLRSELDELQDNVAYTPDDDLYALRYARGGLYVPRDGRKKRSVSDDVATPSGATMAKMGAGSFGVRPFHIMDQQHMVDLDDMLRSKPWPAFVNRNGMDKHMAVHRTGPNQRNKDKMEAAAKKLASSRFSRSSYYYDDDDDDINYNSESDEGSPFAAANRAEFGRSGQKQSQHPRLGQFAQRFDHSDTRER